MGVRVRVRMYASSPSRQSKALLSAWEIGGDMRRCGEICGDVGEIWVI